ALRRRRAPGGRARRARRDRHLGDPAVEGAARGPREVARRPLRSRAPHQPQHRPDDRRRPAGADRRRRHRRNRRLPPGRPPYPTGRLTRRPTHPLQGRDMADITISPDEIRSALKDFVAGYEPSKATTTEVGTVIDAADGIAHVEGLPGAMANELLRFEDGTLGLAL